MYKVGFVVAAYCALLTVAFWYKRGAANCLEFLSPFHIEHLLRWFISISKIFSRMSLDNLSSFYVWCSQSIFMYVFLSGMETLITAIVLISDTI